MAGHKARFSSNETVQNRAARGGLVSGVSFALNLCLNLIQVPLLLRFWHQEEYGLWLSVGALATLLTTLDGGHQLFIGNRLNRLYVEDWNAFQRTLSSAVRVAFLTSFVQIVLALILCFSGMASRWLGIENNRSADYALAVVIYTVGWISTGSVGSILVRLFPPMGFFVRSTWWSIGMRLSQFIAVIVAAILGWGLVCTTLLFAATVCVLNLLLFYDIRRLFPELYPWWRGGEFRYGLRNLSNASILTVVSLLDLVSLQGVVLLVTSGLGAAVVPLFTTVRTLANTAMQGTGFLLNPIQPDLVRYHVQRDGGKISAVFGLFWFITSAVMNGGMVVALFFIERVYGIWTQGRLEFERTLFGWLVAAVLVRTLAAPMQCYLSGINHLHSLLTAAIARASITIVGVLVLAPMWRLGGVGAALFFAELIGSLLLPLWYARSALAEIGYRQVVSVLGVAVISTVVACIALACFVAEIEIWPWMAAVGVVLLLGISLVQWHALQPEVKVRISSLGRSIFGAWVPIALTR